MLEKILQNGVKNVLNKMVDILRTFFKLQI